MVDMQLSNKKLIDRGIKMIIMETGLDRAAALSLLDIYGSVRQVLDAYNKN